jgi:hypothetical protein
MYHRPEHARGDYGIETEVRSCHGVLSAFDLAPSHLLKPGPSGERLGDDEPSIRDL